MATHANYGRNTTATEVAAAFSDRIKGLTVLITGVGLDGIGGATAIALAAHGPSHILIAGRSRAKLDAVVSGLHKSFPSVTVTPLILDLASQKSVRSVADQVNRLVDSIDLLINNAGIMAVPEKCLTPEGIELQFGTNHIGHFLLTNLLMSKLRAAAAKRPGITRVVNLGSSGHLSSPIRFQDYNFDGKAVDAKEVGVTEMLTAYGLPTVPVEEYNPLIAYGQSKTANVLFSVYIAKHLSGQGINSFSLHPGEIFTELGRYMPEELLNSIKERVPNPKSLDQGASTTLVAALDPALASYPGVYLSDCQVTAPAPYASDPEQAEKLWKLSEQLVGQEFKM